MLTIRKSNTPIECAQIYRNSKFFEYRQTDGSPTIP